MLKQMKNVSLSSIIASVGCILVVLFVSFTYSYNAWKKVDEIKTITYNYSTLTYQNHEIGENAVRLKLVAVDDQIVQYQIPLVDYSGQTGELYIEITEDTKCLGQLSGNLEKMVVNNSLIIPMSDFSIQRGKQYTLIINGTISSPVSIKVDESNEARSVQLYYFQDADLFHRMIIIINIILIVICAVCSIFRIRLHILFLIISIIVGILFVFVNPPLTVPDEYRHFVRQYEISRGQIIAEQYSEKDEYWMGAGYLPVSDFPIELAKLKAIGTSGGDSYHLESINKVFTQKLFDMFFEEGLSGESFRTVYHGTRSICPVAYIPQILGIWLSMIICNVPVWIFYGARIGSMIINSIIICYSIRKTPTYKMLFFVIGLLPSVLFARSSCSTDGLLLALILLFLAHVLSICQRENNSIRIRDILLLLVIGVWIGLIKIPYILICASVLLIKPTFLGKIKPRFRQTISTLILLLICISALTLNKLNNLIMSSFVPAGGPASTNMTYLLEHFIDVMNLVSRVFFANINTYIIGACGTWGMFYIVGLFCVARIDAPNDISIWDRWIFAFITIGLMFGLCMAGYFMYPPLGNEIRGIQNRYFIPALIFLPMCVTLPVGEKLKRYELIKKCVTILTSGAATISLIVLCSGFYI